MKENKAAFFNRLSFLPFEDRLDIELAYALCKYWFRAKQRKEKDDKGQPVRYFEHLRRATLILIDELKIVEPAMIITLICHDALEDTLDTDLAAAQIEKRFGGEVIKMVKLLSKVPEEGYLDRLVAFGGWKCLMLKACDRLDNLRSLKAGSIDFQHKQIKETKEKYYSLFDYMVDVAPETHKAQVRYLRDQIKSIADNFEFRDAKEVVAFRSVEMARQQIATLKEIGANERVIRAAEEVLKQSNAELQNLLTIKEAK